MKRLVPVLVATAALAAPAVAEVLESQTKAYPASNLEGVRLDFPVGELTIEGSDSDKVRVKLYVHCDRHSSGGCEDRADDIELDARRRGGHLILDVDGYSWFGRGGMWVEAVIQMPRALDLDVEMGVGEVEIEGMEGDLELHLKVGEVTVRMPEEKVQRVRAEVGIGEASMDRSGGHASVAGLLGRKIRWTDGPGKARVDVSVGIGELELRLM